MNSKITIKDGNGARLFKFSSAEFGYFLDHFSLSNVTSLSFTPFQNHSLQT